MTLNYLFFMMYFSGILLSAVFNRGIFNIIGVSHFLYFSLFMIAPFLVVLILGRLKLLEIIFIFLFSIFFLIKLTNGIGPYAVQDSFIFIYPLYYVLGLNVHRIFGPKRVEHGFALMCKMSCLYGLIYPIRHYLPFQEYLIFGSYYVILYISVAYLLFFDKTSYRRFWLCLAIAAILVHASRSGYITGLTMGLLFLVYFKNISIINMLKILTIFIPAIAFAQALSFDGLARSFSLSYLSDSIISIFISEYKADIYNENFSGSKSHRLLMWSEVIITGLKPENIWTGIQSGVALVDTSFRNPHNSYFSVFGRGGFIGLTLYILLGLFSVTKFLSSIPGNKNIWKVVLPPFSILPLFTTLIDSPMTAIPFMYSLGVLSILGKYNPRWQ